MLAGISSAAVGSELLNYAGGNVAITAGAATSGAGGGINVFGGAGASTGGNIHLKPGTGNAGGIMFKRPGANFDENFYDFTGPEVYRNWGEDSLTGNSLTYQNGNIGDSGCNDLCEADDACVGWTRFNGAKGGTTCETHRHLDHTFTTTGALMSKSTVAMAATAQGILWNHDSGTTVTGAATWNAQLTIGTSLDPVTSIFRGATSSINGNHEFTCSGVQLGDIVLAVPNGNDLVNALGNSDARRIIMTAHVKSANTCELRFVNAGLDTSGYEVRIGNSANVGTYGDMQCYSPEATTRTIEGVTSFNELSGQCCTFNMVSQTHEGSRPNCLGQSGGVTYQQAFDNCIENGLELCTSEQVAENIGAGSGCSHDNRHVWTSTPCEWNGNYLTSSVLQSATLNSWTMRWLAIRVTN